MKEVLTPESPHWNTFAGNLEAIIEMYGCDGDRAHRHARFIMAKMTCGEIDVEASIAVFEENGGYCDCEILFNVEHSFRASRGRSH